MATETTTTVDDAIGAAKAAAYAFFGEFEEPLDPAETDWDATAWTIDAQKLRLSPEQQEALWPVYQAVLVARTRELSEQS